MANGRRAFSSQALLGRDLDRTDWPLWTVAFVAVSGSTVLALVLSDLTLSLLVMVVLGGPGTRWGPLAGGFAFAFLDNRLVAAGSSDAVAGLPSVLRGPLSQPLFILGTVFILAVYFFPGGLAGLIPARFRRERTSP